MSTDSAAGPVLPPPAPPAASAAVPRILSYTSPSSNVTFQLVIEEAGPSSSGGFTYQSSESEWAAASDILLNVQYSLPSAPKKYLSKTYFSPDVLSRTLSSSPSSSSSSSPPPPLSSYPPTPSGVDSFVAASLAATLRLALPDVLEGKGGAWRLLPTLTFGILGSSNVVVGGGNDNFSCPLVWKVDFRWEKDSSAAPDQPGDERQTTVLLHTASTFAGSVVAPSFSSPSATSSEDGANHLSLDPPTSVYINAYQSWGFSGTVRSPDKQPRHTLPDSYCKEFHRGAEAPPLGLDAFRPRSPEEPHPSLQLQLIPTLGCGDAPPGAPGARPSPARRPPAKGSVDRSFSPRSDVWSGAGIGYYSSETFFLLSSCPAPDALRPDSQLSAAGGPALLLGRLSSRLTSALSTASLNLLDLAQHVCYSGAALISPVGGTVDAAGGEALPPKPPGEAEGSAAAQLGEWSYLQLLDETSYNEEHLADYLDAFATLNSARCTNAENSPAGRLDLGWCSWYDFYNNVDEEKVRRNVAALADNAAALPTQVVVVDDGYMTAWGDWDSLKPGKFPSNSMRAVSDAIKAKGMRAGLWLAPFACDKHSKLAAAHPSWIIKGLADEKPANSANCGKWFYGLDASNPEVIQHVTNVIKTAVVDWGFDVLKLDFLYSSCLLGRRHDQTLTRAEVMNLALSTLRTAAGPNVFIIGCGCPTMPSVGYVDAMRVSADTGPTWAPPLPLPWWDRCNLPCLRSMVRSALSRSPYSHRLFRNDPDCLLLRPSTKLTRDEVVSAATVIALTGGMLLLSDDLSTVPADRLDIAKKIYPICDCVALPLDLHVREMSSILRLRFSDTGRHNRGVGEAAPGMGTWMVAALCNWESEKRQLTFPDITDPAYDDVGSEAPLGYHVFAFWSQRYVWMPNDRSDLGFNLILKKTLKPHESEIFAIKPVGRGDRPCYIASSLHFSGGSEVASICSSVGVAGVSGSIDVVFKAGADKDGEAFFFLPFSFANAATKTTQQPEGEGAVAGGSNAAPATRAPEIVVTVDGQQGGKYEVAGLVKEGSLGLIISVKVSVKKVGGGQVSILWR